MNQVIRGRSLRSAVSVLLAASHAWIGVAAAAGEGAPSTARLEPKAIELLKETGARLAAARTLGFTAVVSYESPSRLGPPLVYTTTSEILVDRPDKLRVVTSGDGPASELYDDGQNLMVFAPAENLVAVAPAPPAIDATLRTLYDSAATYFPFAELIVTDPFAGMTEGVTVAYYIGRSNVVGDTGTEMVAYVSDVVFAQIWIGVEDKLPRRMRAIYAADPAQLRHQIDVSDWKLDFFIHPDVFASPAAAAATRIDFGRPDPQLPPGGAGAKKSRPAGR